jgi:hypothetical protein
VLPIIINIDYEECGVKILQVRLNFACYYGMPKDWIPETYKRQQRYTLKYSAGSGNIKRNLNIQYLGNIILVA